MVVMTIAYVLGILIVKLTTYSENKRPVPLAFIVPFTDKQYRLLDSLVVECWLRVREVPGSIPSQGSRHTKDIIKMVAVVPLFSTEHSKGKILALSQELR